MIIAAALIAGVLFEAPNLIEVWKARPSLTDHRDGSPVTAGCEPGKRIIIAPEQSGAEAPRIWGDWIVWIVDRGSATDAYGYYIPSGEVRVLANGPDVHSPVVVQGSIVVWRDAPANASEMRLVSYNLSSGTETTLPLSVRGVDMAPRAISGDWILLDGGGNETTSGLYVYNIATQEVRQLTNFTTGVGVGMWNDEVVWVRQGSVIPGAPRGYAQLVLYNITTKNESVVHEFVEYGGSAPDLFRDVIVFERGNATTLSGDIAGYNLTNDTEWTIAPSTSIHNTHQIPRISGAWVVYEDIRGSTLGITAYNISTGRTQQLSTGGDSTDVWQNRAVWTEWGASGARTIALTCLPDT